MQCILSASVFENHAFALSFGNIINLSNTADGDSSVPHAAVSGENVYVVWEDDDSGEDEILFARSTDHGASFSDPVIISTTTSSSFQPKLATSDIGNEIYVVWEEEGEIYFTASTNNATGLTEPINVSSSANISRSPQITSSGSSVYVLWEEDVTNANTDILISVSDNGGSSFADAVNLSNSTLQSSTAQLFATEEETYILWKEFDNAALVGNIFLSSTSDGGTTFTAAVNISGALLGDAFFPNLAVSGSNVYVVWGDAVNLDTFLAVSSDGGQNFSDPINLSNSTFVFAANPDVVASGDSVHIVWQDEIAGLAEIFFVSVSIDGTITGTPINISNSSSSISFSPKIAASGQDQETIYVVWQESSPADVFLALSTDGGHSFDDPINLSSSGGVGFAALSQIMVSENSLIVVWEDSSEGEFEIFSRTLTKSGPPSITIDAVSNSAPRWGVDPVTISGTVSGNSTDMITIDWADGESDTLSVEGSSWGPISHTYSSTSTGTREIVVELLSDLGAGKSSASRVVEVQKHATSLEIDDVLSVIHGSDITVTGMLTDTDLNEPIGAMNITFTGSGVTSALPPALTQAEGTYSSSGASPDFVSENVLTVQAHFAGDAAYDSSDSKVVGYDTVAGDATAFVVPAGEPSGPIELTGFNASIVFDRITTAGSIFVSECTPPVSARYVAVDGMCLKISSAVHLEGDSSAHITISYEGLSIPPGYSVEDLGVFHDSVLGIVDITESRNVNEDSITGRTKDFSRFIGGIALHSDPPVGAERLPVFVGYNDLVFEFPQNRNIRFSSGELTIDASNTVSVVEPYANTNGNEIDTIDVTITSSSDPSGINVRFLETGLDTGMFEGSFTIAAGSSSEAESTLDASAGDEIAASYTAPGMAPLRVIINDVIEAGIVEVAGFGIPSLFNAPVDAYDIRLVDAALGQNPTVTVVMSYRNFTGLSDPLQLGIALLNGTACSAVISGTSDTLDVDAQTVTGRATTLGQFVLVLDDHIPADRECFALGFPPGGGGGGLPRPGTSIILFDNAVVVQGDSEQSAGDRSSGGGGGSSRSTSITHPSTGTNIIVSMKTNLGTVTVRFDSVNEGSGQLKIESYEFHSFEEIFEEIRPLQDDNLHGMTAIDGVIYATAGDVFDIDASAVRFTGTVEVTIPYDEKAVMFFGSESEVKFLHYNAATMSWEEMTSSVNEEANTVTGTLDSLSPVTAGIIIAKVEDDSPTSVHLADPILTVTGTNQLTLSTDLAVEQQINQEYVFLVQVVDDRNVAQYIEWQKGTLSGSQVSPVSVSWTAMEKGRYTVTVVVISDMENPVMLSEAIYRDLTI